MKKIVLFSFLIFYLVSVLNAFTAENNNNNIDNKNNNNNNNKISDKEFCASFPKDIWLEIALKLIDIKKIQNATELSELKKAIKDLVRFSLISKFHNKIVNDLEFLINGKKIKLKDFIKQTENEILLEIKEILKGCFQCNWFNSINATDEEGCTALMYAATFGHIDVVELLIQNGADLNLKNSNGWTALTCVVFKGDEVIIKLLIEKGANVYENDVQIAYQRGDSIASYLETHLRRTECSEKNNNNNTQIKPIKKSKNKKHKKCIIQ